MRSAFINIDERQIHYLQAGKGKQLLIAFHGYKNNAYMFEPFVQYWRDSFTMIFIDLPYHGNTKWPDERKLTKKDLTKLVLQLKEEYQADNISLMGYSIGGRVCLCIIEEICEEIAQCVVIASDGLVFHPLYYFVTKNVVGKWLFNKFLSNEKHLRLIDNLHSANLLNHVKYRFIMAYIKDPKERIALQKIWMNLSLLVPNVKRLRKKIRDQNIKLTIFMGEKDTIIPVVKAKKFMKDLPSVKLQILNKGHRILDNETIPVIAKTLLHK